MEPSCSKKSSAKAEATWHRNSLDASQPANLHPTGELHPAITKMLNQGFTLWAIPSHSRTTTKDLFFNCWPCSNHADAVRLSEQYPDCNWAVECLASGLIAVEIDRTALNQEEELYKEHGDWYATLQYNSSDAVVFIFSARDSISRIWKSQHFRVHTESVYIPPTRFRHGQRLEFTDPSARILPAPDWLYVSGDCTTKSMPSKVPMNELSQYNLRSSYDQNIKPDKSKVMIRTMEEPFFTPPPFVTSEHNTHPVYMSFERRNGWRCRFINKDQISISREYAFSKHDKIVEIARRGKGITNTIDQYCLEQSILLGKGGIWLELTDKQVRALKQR
jgi:hypothetical protein